jgi:glycosyltransferase involved in cell wall biosynthesis
MTNPFGSKTKSPFFTVLTASLNSGNTLQSMLDSVKTQTCRDLEHIVIDGGSSDKTSSILKEYEGTYHLLWRSEIDKGIAEALNKGLAESRGAYVVVIQADDRFLYSHILAQVFPLLKNETYDICSFPLILDHPVLGSIIRKPIRALWWNRFKFIFLHQGCFVHRRVFERIGGFNEDFSIAMDYDFFYRAVMAGCTVKFFREPPVAFMGGSGVGTRPDCLTLRLQEERLVQDMNERNRLWRVAQVLFRKLYSPYKTKLLPRISQSDKEIPISVLPPSQRGDHDRE